MKSFNSKHCVKWFEAEQKAWGTATAIHNLIFLLADELLGTVGSRLTRVSKKPAKKRAAPKNK